MERSAPAEGRRGERLDWKTVCRLFPDQWVVLTSIDWMSSVGTEMTSAIVITHATSRETALEAALPVLRHHAGEFACVFTTRQIFLCRPSGLPGRSG